MVSSFCHLLTISNILTLYILSKCILVADVCPSSIASYFNKNGFECQECISRSITSRKYNMTIPTGTDDFGLLDTWLSYFSLDIKM